MTRFIKSTAAVLTLGIAGLVPSFAKADDHRGHFDRNDRREVRDVRPTRVEVRRDGHRDFVRHDVIIDRRPIVRDRVIVEPTPVYVAPVETDTAVSLSQVPACVMDTLNLENRGPVESVQYVCRDGRDFYRFIVEGRGGNLDMRIGVNGKLLSVTGC